jgi:hypothetical protein
LTVLANLKITVSHCPKGNVTYQRLPLPAGQPWLTQSNIKFLKYSEVEPFLKEGMTVIIKWGKVADCHISKNHNGKRCDETNRLRLAKRPKRAFLDGPS